MVYVPTGLVVVVNGRNACRRVGTGVHAMDRKVVSQMVRKDELVRAML